MAHAPLHADEPRMVVNTLSGDPVTVDLTTATRITFSADQTTMTVSAAGDATTVEIDNIASIAFTLDSGIDSPAHEDDGLTIASQGAVVTIAGAGIIDYIAADATGRTHFAGKTTASVILDFTDRPAGIYIIRANNTTFKFIKR